MTDSCMELKNIQYNTMLKKGHNLTPTINSSVYTEINSFLNEEMKLNLNKSWIQLDNTNKLKKLYTFAEEYCKKNEINDCRSRYQFAQFSADVLLANTCEDERSFDTFVNSSHNTRLNIAATNKDTNQ